MSGVSPLLSPQKRFRSGPSFNRPIRFPLVHAREQGCRRERTLDRLQPPVFRGALWATPSPPLSFLFLLFSCLFLFSHHIPVTRRALHYSRAALSGVFRVTATADPGARILTTRERYSILDIGIPVYRGDYHQNHPLESVSGNSISACRQMSCTGPVDRGVSTGTPSTDPRSILYCICLFNGSLPRYNRVRGGKTVTQTGILSSVESLFSSLPLFFFSPASDLI